MIFLMTSRTANSIESLLSLPFNIFKSQFKLAEDMVRAEIEAANKRN